LLDLKKKTRIEPLTSLRFYAYSQQWDHDNATSVPKDELQIATKNEINAWNKFGGMSNNEASKLFLFLLREESSSFVNKNFKDGVPQMGCTSCFLDRGPNETFHVRCVWWDVHYPCISSLLWTPKTKPRVRPVNSELMPVIAPSAQDVRY
jgi:acyl-CoA-binding protein